MKRKPPLPVKLSDEEATRIRDDVFEKLQPALAGEFTDQFFLVDVGFEKEAGQWYLRVYLEGKDASISLNDCERVSRKLEPFFDELACVGDIPYNLEISSPGLFRAIKTQREFDFYKGRPVKATSESRELTLQGILEQFDDARKTVSIKLSDSPNELGEIVELSAEDFRVELNPPVEFPE